jgi:hypothetical protein
MEGTVLNSFYEITIHLFQNYTRTQQKNYRTISSMNIQQIDTVGFIPGMQALLNICKSINVIQHTNKFKDKNHMIISLNAEQNL